MIGQTQDEFPDGLIHHCEQVALDAVASDTGGLVRAVLSASGYAKLVAALEALIAIGKPGRRTQYLPGTVGAQAFNDAMVAYRKAQAALAAAAHKQGSGK